ncbi:hypothetical protein CBS101457_003100 [Exobasidium rhododendri]|nr:hypothetical protein CBS101457_003100 [Exobasidium rhododendri]
MTASPFLQHTFFLAVICVRITLQAPVFLRSEEAHRQDNTDAQGEYHYHDQLGRLLRLPRASPAPPLTDTAATVASSSQPVKEERKKRPYVFKLPLEERRRGQKPAHVPDADLAKMTLRELVLSRPYNVHREGDKADRWDRTFSNHVDIRKLDPFTMSSQEYELAFRKLRGDQPEEPKVIRKMTNAIQRHLRSQPSVPDAYTDQVLQHWKNHSDALSQRRGFAKEMKRLSNLEQAEWQEWQRKQKLKNRLYSQTKQQRSQNGYRTRKGRAVEVVKDLERAGIPAGLDVDQMEKWIRPIAEKHPDEKAVTAALLEVLSSERGEEYAQGVLNLRKSRRRKEDLKRGYYARVEREKLKQSEMGEEGSSQQHFNMSNDGKQGDQFGNDWRSSSSRLPCHHQDTSNEPVPSVPPFLPEAASSPTHSQWDSADWWDSLLGEGGF